MDTAEVKSRPALIDCRATGKFMDQDYSDSKNPFHTNPKCSVRSAPPYSVGIPLSFGELYIVHTLGYKISPWVM